MGYNCSLYIKLFFLASHNKLVNKSGYATINKCSVCSTTNQRKSMSGFKLIKK